MSDHVERLRLRAGLCLIKALDDYRSNPQQLTQDALRVIDVYASPLKPLNECPELWLDHTTFMEKYTAFRHYVRDVARTVLTEIADSLEHHIMIGTPFSPIAESNLETAVNYFGKCLQFTCKHADDPLLSALHVIELHCFLLFACSFLEPFLSIIADTESPEESRLLSALHVTAIARLWHDEFGNLDFDNALSVVFSIAKEQLSLQSTKNSSAPLVCEARKQINPGGTGRAHEHEVAESCLELPEDTPSPLEIAPSMEPDPAEVVAGKDLLERIFTNLKEDERVLLQMYAEGHTDEEVATLLGATPESVKKRRQRLINRLRHTFAS